VDLSGRVEGYRKLAGGQAPCREDNRNFVAHAGLLYSFTRVCSHDNDYLIDVDEKTFVCLER